MTWRHWAVGLAAFLLSPNPVGAQEECTQYKAMAEALKEKYGEELYASGLSMAGNALVIAKNPDTGSWTALVTKPDGCTKILGAGTFFEIKVQGPRV